MNKLFAVLFAALLCACTATERRNWVAVGGSKADGTVILGIDIPAKFGVSETMAQWDDKQADAEADVRCKNWGYAGASTFRNELPVQVVCHQIPGGISPCGAKTYRILYQCVDKNQQN